jgi:hypothetical protein
MTGDKAIRVLTAAVVQAVAAFAAVVSYSHIYALGHAHGQSGVAARLLPLSVDGLILAASLVALHEARRRHSVPPLARCMLVLGVGATVAANVAYGAPYGPLGALISAWPAVAFIGSAEMLMALVRASAGQSGPVCAHGEPPVLTGHDAALAAYRASVAAGSPISARQLAARHGISRRQAGQVVATVTHESNGQH